MDVRRQGQIVLVTVTDPRGANPKPRPAVILTGTDELQAADEIVVAAISTVFEPPLPKDWIEIPWSGDGRSKTGLTRPSVVKCHWLKRIRRSDILHIVGYLPAEYLVKVMRVETKN